MSAGGASTESRLPPAALAALASEALLGTDRTGGAKEAARSLLRRAGVLGAMKRAGAAGVSAGETLPECPEESRPVARAGAAAILQKLLDSADAAVIGEWCGLALERGVVVPAGLCPALLDWWSRHTSRDERVVLAMGERGQWLRNLNPEWKKPGGSSEGVPSDLDSAWQTGTLAERESLLKAVRRVDANRARELVAATWSADVADARRRFVSALTLGLGASDESFLEACLDDRSKVVRRAAVELLAKLPGSRLSMRMLERAAAMIRVDAGKGDARAATLTIEPPGEYDPAWARDDVEEKPPEGRGKRAYWMSQILMSTPLSELSVRVRLSADEFIAGVEGIPYSDEIRSALLHAATEQEHEAWLKGFARLILKQSKDVEQLPAIWKRLPPSDAEELVLRVIGMRNVAWYTKWTLLGEAEFAWSAEFSKKACQAAGVPPRKREEEWSVYRGIEDVARRVHPVAIDELERALNACYFNDLPATVRLSLDRARLRAEMHKEFSL